MSEVQDNPQTSSGQSEIQKSNIHTKTASYPHPSLPMDIQQCSEYHMGDESGDGDDEADEADENDYLGMCTSTSTLQFALSASSEGGNTSDESERSDPFYWDHDASRRRACHIPLSIAGIGQGGNNTVVNRVSASSSSSSSVKTTGSIQAVCTEENLDNTMVVLVVDNKGFLTGWFKSFWGVMLGVFWERARK